MAENPTTFTPDSARRIADATRKVERMPLRYGVTDNAPRDPEESIWAVITGYSPLPPHGAYNWVQVTPQGSNGWVPLIGGASGQGNAYENSGRWPIPVPSVVRLYVAPDDPDTGDPRWCFTYDQPSTGYQFVPPHDHRDNFNGGFAFSVYHPGTAVPQMPWAL